MTVQVIHNAEARYDKRESKIRVIISVCQADDEEKIGRMFVKKWFLLWYEEYEEQTAMTSDMEGSAKEWEI